MDLNKAGFFHLETELVERKLEPEKVTYWRKKQEEKLLLWPKNWVEVGAIENTIGVFTYVLEGKDEAISYFNGLLQKPGRSRVNTLANLVFLHSEESDAGKEFNRELQEIQKSDSISSRLDVCRGRCERGYFCGFYISEEVHNTELIHNSYDLLKTGSETGSCIGMSPNELCIWQSYQFKAAKDIFVNQVVLGNNADAFVSVMETFLKFYHDVEDEANYYKSTSLVEVATMFIMQREQIEKHPEFTRFCKDDETLADIWNNATTAFEDAIGMLPSNYRLYVKAARVYCKMGEFDKAQRSVEKSLEINKDMNLSGMHCQLTIYKQRAFIAATEDKNENEAMEWYVKAYECGKEIERNHTYIATATFVEMNYICFNMAVDRAKQPWGIRQGSQAYLDEAILYGEKALESLYKRDSPRALKGLAQCYAVQNDYLHAAQYMAHAASVSKPGDTGNLFLYLKYLSESYHKYRQPDTITEIVTAFQEAWTHHPEEAAVSTIGKYCMNYVASRNRLVTNVLGELASQSSEKSTEILQKVCTYIIANRCKPWLKDICLQYTTI